MAVDTSVAVPMLVASHEAHALVRTWAEGRVLGLSGRALAGTDSVLTRLPGDARVSAADAVELIDDNFVERVVLSPDETRAHDVTLATRDARARPTYEAIGARVEVVVESLG